MKILILYGSSEGQTRKIAHFITEVLQQQKHHVEVYSVKNLPSHLELNNFDGIIIGASVHVGQYPKYVVKFAKDHQPTLSKMSNAFFSVSMSAYDKSPAGQQETQQYINRLIQRTGWTPQQTVAFAGAVLYKQYNFLIRLVMKFIAKQKQLSTDTSRDHEYTDWNDVKQFGKEFIARIMNKETQSLIKT